MPTLKERQEVLLGFEEETVAALLQQKLRALGEKEQKKEGADIAALLSECKELSERLGKLKAARFKS